MTVRLLRLLRHRHDETGAYLVLYAFLATVLFVVAALVLDITALREDRQSSRLAADAAATAGASVLQRTTGQTACRKAWDYFVANAPGLSGPAPAPNCSTLAGLCDSSTARTPAVNSIGDFEVTIANPVLPGDPLMLAEAPGGDVAQSGTNDGDACDRIAVRVRRTRNLALAGIAGIGSSQTDVHSVARAVETTTGAGSLIVLDPTGCGSLRTTGTGRLQASLASGPGVIHVDSSGGACAPGSYVIDPSTAGAITAPNGGQIRSFAAGANLPAAYDNGDIPTRLSPRPISAVQLGRGLVDSQYPLVAPFVAPLLVGNTTGLPVYGDDPILEPCTITTPRVIPLNSYVDCPAGFLIDGGDAFLLGTRFVFSAGFTIRNGGCLAVNNVICNGSVPSTGDAVVIVQNGNIVKETDTQLVLDRVFVYLGGSGSLTLTGGQPAQNVLQWRAPTTDAATADIAFWTESTGVMTVGGHNRFEMEGVVFAPNTSEFLLAPIAGGTTARSQLIANRVRVDGGNQTFEVGPDELFVRATLRSVRLIR